MTKFIILTATDPNRLQSEVSIKLCEGYKLHGIMNVVTTHQTLRYSGSQHHGTHYEIEYSQAMVKEEKETDDIKLLILYRNGVPSSIVGSDYDWDEDVFESYDEFFVPRSEWEKGSIDLTNYKKYITK